MILRHALAGVLLLCGLTFTLSAKAVDNSSPIGIGLFPPVQIPNSEFTVRGLRLGLANVSRGTHGLDIGVANVTKQSFKGIQLAALFNYNHVSSRVVGLQLAPLANINNTDSKLYGIQAGLYNKVGKVYGIQFGLINVAHELHGIQIGLINFNQAGPFKVTPIINVAF